MIEMADTNNLLSILDNLMLEDSTEVAVQIAENFRKRRVEKNITRKHIAELSGVPLSTVSRFEQNGLISLESLIKLAMALGYTADIRNLFGAPKFDTMEELDMIRSKTGDKRAYPKKNKK